MKPQTIEIFLVEGTPSGVKIAEITHRVIQAVMVPRNKISYIAKREELKNVGLYFLFGDDPTKVRTRAYIGETEECLKRLKSHSNKKDFWTHAIAITSQKKSFTKSHVQFLEHLAVKEAQDANRFDLSENKIIPREPHVTESMKADLLDYFDTIKILLSTLGYPIFDKIDENGNYGVQFFINRVGVRATAKYVNEGMLIMKGSEARIEEAVSCHKFISNLRLRLLEEGILTIKNKKYIFNENYLVSSPSTASNLIIGSSTNGWEKWKDINGSTLDSIIRK